MRCRRRLSCSCSSVRRLMVLAMEAVRRGSRASATANSPFAGARELGAGCSPGSWLFTAIGLVALLGGIEVVGTRPSARLQSGMGGDGRWPAGSSRRTLFAGSCCASSSARRQLGALAATSVLFGACT
jgi:hypothetical protein